MFKFYIRSWAFSVINILLKIKWSWVSRILLLLINHYLPDDFLVVRHLVVLSIMFLRISLYLDLLLLHHFIIWGSWKWDDYSEIIIIFRLLIGIANLSPGSLYHYQWMTKPIIGYQVFYNLDILKIGTFSSLYFFDY